MVQARSGSIINIGSLYAAVSPDPRFYDHIKSDPPFLKPPCPPPRRRIAAAVLLGAATVLCGVGLMAVNRLHTNTRTASGVGYRHTADASIRASLLAEGWTDEGVVFCAAAYSSPH